MSASLVRLKIFLSNALVMLIFIISDLSLINLSFQHIKSPLCHFLIKSYTFCATNSIEPDFLPICLHLFLVMR